LKKRLAAKAPVAGVALQSLGSSSRLRGTSWQLKNLVVDQIKKSGVEWKASLIGASVGRVGRV
jgi:hypothetical protein